MKSKSAVLTEVETALRNGKKRLRELERKRGVRLPPPPVGARKTESALREHFYALLESGSNPHLYSAILQHYLQSHMMPIPSGVFKQRFYNSPTSTALSPDGKPRPIFGSKVGRPSKADEALAVALKWLDYRREFTEGEKGQPSYGQFYQQLNRERTMTPQEIKKGADRIRQQILSVFPVGEES